MTSVVVSVSKLLVVPELVDCSVGYAVEVDCVSDAVTVVELEIGSLFEVQAVEGTVDVVVESVGTEAVEGVPS